MNYNHPRQYATQLSPRYDGVGMGGILSTLTFGLIKKKQETVTLSHDEIMSQIALIVIDKLTAAGRTADPAKAKEAAGYYLNQYGAWAQVLTDANITESIANQTITALLASNLVKVAPGYVGAGEVVPPVPPTPVNTALDIPALISNPNYLLIGGAGLLGLILLTGGRRGRR